MKAIPVTCPVNVSALDDPDPKAGNASHKYGIQYGGPNEVLVIQFQHGPRGEGSSIPGVFEDAVLAIIQDRLEGFQSGEFKTAENELALSHVKSAREALGERVARRMARGVLGVNKQ